jgi:hypothetical protein
VLAGRESGHELEVTALFGAALQYISHNLIIFPPHFGCQKITLFLNGIGGFLLSLRINDVAEKRDVGTA